MKSVLERNLGFLGYPNYSVDTDGNVWSFYYRGYKRKTPKKLNGGKHKDNYSLVSLTHNSYIKTFTVHKLVALSFIPNQNESTEIDHINGDRADNRVCNLRWCTHKENINNPITLVRKKRRLGVIIKQYSKDGILIKEHTSLRGIERELNFSRRHIRSCLKGKIKSAYGYIWKYKEDSK